MLPLRDAKEGHFCKGVVRLQESLLCSKLRVAFVL